MGRKYKQLSLEERTMVFYESPLRLVRTLTEMMVYFGEGRNCCVSRELTKLFEENQRGTLDEVAAYYKEKGVKGEIVIVVEGCSDGRRMEPEEPAGDEEL